MGLPVSSDSKESFCNAGDLGLISGLGRSPSEGNGNPLQYSCLENPTERGAWQATVHGVPKSRTQQKQFRTCTDLWLWWKGHHVTSETRSEKVTQHLFGIPTLGTQSACKNEAQSATWPHHSQVLWMRFQLTGNIDDQACERWTFSSQPFCHLQTRRPQSMWTEKSHHHCARSEFLNSEFHRIFEHN